MTDEQNDQTDVEDSILDSQELKEEDTVSQKTDNGTILQEIKSFESTRTQSNQIIYLIGLLVQRRQVVNCQYFFGQFLREQIFIFNWTMIFQRTINVVIDIIK